MTKTVDYVITSEPILILPRMNEPFQIETDASGYGVGAVLVYALGPNWMMFSLLVIIGSN